MISLKNLLTNICQSLITLNTWKNNMNTILTQVEPVGQVVTASLSSATSVATSTYTKVLTITLGPGDWFIDGWIRFPSNATGRRWFFLVQDYSSGTPSGSAFAESQNAISGAQVRFETTMGVVTTNTTSTFSIVAWQNSGSALSISTAGMRAVKVH